MTPPRRRSPATGSGRAFVEDPLTGAMAERRRVQPFEARKQYICPGCHQEIRTGHSHEVMVPLGSPEARRHWHTPCLERALRHGLR